VPISLSDIITSIVTGIIYDFGKHWLLYFLAIGSINLLLRYFTSLIKTNKDVLVLWVSMLVLLSATTYLVGSKPQEANLLASVSRVTTGASDDPKSTIAALEMTVVNNGTMQSIAGNWAVSASINGVKYDASIVEMPSRFTFALTMPPANGPNAITYHKEDALPQKQCPPYRQAGLLLEYYLSYSMGCHRMSSKVGPIFW